VILDDLRVDQQKFEARTGWSVTHEGLCKGELCVPAKAVPTGAGLLDVTALSSTLGMPLVHDRNSNTYALGPESLGRCLTTAVAPDLELPNAVDGSTFRLSAMHGRKVLLVAWASW
jgi:hypothetical protein